MITNYIKEITCKLLFIQYLNYFLLTFLFIFKGLKAPSYPEDGTEKIEMNGPVLMEDQELVRWLNSEKGGKDLKWSNYFIEISDTVSDLQASTFKSSKKYKGHWRNEEH